jgi:hypothetical protein
MFLLIPSVGNARTESATASPARRLPGRACGTASQPTGVDPKPSSARPPRRRRIVQARRRPALRAGSPPKTPATSAKPPDRPTASHRMGGGDPQPIAVFARRRQNLEPRRSDLARRTRQHVLEDAISSSPPARVPTASTSDHAPRRRAAATTSAGRNGDAAPQPVIAIARRPVAETFHAELPSGGIVYRPARRATASKYRHGVIFRPGEVLT